LLTKKACIAILAITIEAYWWLRLNSISKQLWWTGMHWQHQLQKCSVLCSSCLPSSLPQVSPLGHCRLTPLDWLHESKAQFIFTYCTAAWVSNQYINWVLPWLSSKLHRNDI
jgi:hypothetical protein